METHTEEGRPMKSSSPREAGDSPYAILFELEGVAANGRRAAFEVLKSILGEHNLDLTPFHFSRYCLHPKPDRYIPVLLDALGAKLSADKLAEDVTSGIIMHLSSNAARLPAGLSELFDEAVKRRIPLGALTALPEASAKSILNKLGLEQWGVRIFTPDEEVEEVFPRADTWLKMAKAMRRNSRCCIVLASSKASCKAALSAGMKCVVVPDEFTAFQDFGGADLVLESHDALRPDELLETLCPPPAR